MIILIFTSGNWDMPIYFKDIWNFLCTKVLPPDLISSRIYILGFCDSSYEKYNFAANKLYKRLEMISRNVSLVLADL